MEDNNIMIDERTKKVLYAIIKHCNVINETIDKMILWDVVENEIDTIKMFCKKILKEGG